jgi:hypothetical protein
MPIGNTIPKRANRSGISVASSVDDGYFCNSARESTANMAVMTRTLAVRSTLRVATREAVGSKLIEGISGPFPLA